MDKLKSYLNSQTLKPNFLGLIEQCNEEFGICEVWQSNLEKEFRQIRQIISDYNFVAVDTEFPGIVAKPCGEFRDDNDYLFKRLVCNVNMLRVIQIGFTFMDANGRTAPGFSTWQFNFKFNLDRDMYAQNSIDLLYNSGLQFSKHQEEGIEPNDFAELLTTSGVVLNDEVTFICFHSDYDFGYLLRILTGAPLPDCKSEFIELIRLYFPKIFDVKYMVKPFKSLKGGLQDLSDQLNLLRAGRQHQAGSDSLLTGKVFFKLCKEYFRGQTNEVSKYCGQIYGLLPLGSEEAEKTETDEKTATATATTTPAALPEP